MGKKMVEMMDWRMVEMKELKLDNLRVERMEYWKVLRKVEQTVEK
jgi:hypothetical protein